LSSYRGGRLYRVQGEASTAGKHAQSAGVLADGKINPRKTPISLAGGDHQHSDYLERRKYLKEVAWLPADFSTHKDIKEYWL
jgi:hypothetical protein